jgi:hypothetical protein
MAAEFLTGCACVRDCAACDGCACRAAAPPHLLAGPGKSNDGREAAAAPGLCYSASKRIVVPPSVPVYECNVRCACTERCANRVLQLGPRVRVEVFKTRVKGWALRAAEAVARGTFVCEYTGEVITNDEAERRGERYDAIGFSTLYDLDYNASPEAAEDPARAAGEAESENMYTIDATYTCGVARFLNHSCEPNLQNYSVWVDNLDPAMPRIAFFAAKDIAEGEECAHHRTACPFRARCSPCSARRPRGRGSHDIGRIAGATPRREAGPRARARSCDPRVPPPIAPAACAPLRDIAASCTYPLQADIRLQVRHARGEPRQGRAVPLRGRLLSPRALLTSGRPYGSSRLALAL